MDAFSGLEELVRKGKLTTEETVLGHKIGYRTLSYMEEADAFSRCGDNVLKIRIEQLSLSITSFDGVSISSSEEDRTRLKTLLNNMAPVYLNKIYEPFAKLTNNTPELTQENIQTPLDQDQQLEASTRSVVTMENFQQTP